MLRSGIIRLFIVAAGLWMASAGAVSAQTADTVRVNTVHSELADSVVMQSMPENMPYAVRTLDERLELPVQTDTTVTTSAPQVMSRSERRAMRKAAKKEPVVLPSQRFDDFRVSGGRKAEVLQRTVPADSLGQDSPGMVADGVRDSLMTADLKADSLITITESIEDGSELTLSGMVNQADSLGFADLSRRERRLAEKERMRADTTLYRHSPLFKDTMSISKVTAISVVVPGFGQLYNGHYWKIPVLYGVVGTTTYFGIKEHQKYRDYKKVYDYRLARNFPREFIDPVQNNMIKHNTYRQLLFGAAVASYIYFIGDGAVNYPSTETHIKTATTLSTICPGMGQIYNGSYWRVPIVVGGFASMIYVIDWNNRMYQRYKTAFELETDGDDDTVSEFNGRLSVGNIQTYKDSARRNRDLCIILTGALYVLNIIDAHVDAHLKDYDVSDNLAMRLRLEPVSNTLLTQTQGTTNWFGFNLSYTF